MANYDDFVSLDMDGMNKDGYKFGKARTINRLRIIPGQPRVVRILRAPTDSKYYRIRRQHWNIPIGMGKTPPLACSKSHIDEPCYFCMMVNDYYNSGDPRKQELARKMRASTSVMSNVIDLKDPVGEDGNPKIQVWQYSWKVHQHIIGYFNNPEYGDLTHPKTGRNFKVTANVVSAQGNRTWTQYDLQVGANQSELEVAGALDHLYDLDDTFPLKFYNFDEQKGIFDGTFDPRTGTRKELPSSEEPKQIESNSVPQIDTPAKVEVKSSTDDEWEDVMSGSTTETSDSDDGGKSDIMKKLDELKTIAGGK